jgi:hypothetical protein
MSTFFGFSDECGCYHAEKTEHHLKVHPYYIRSTLLIKADEWKTLRRRFNELKILYDLPLEREIKWAYLWHLRNYQKNGKEIPANKDFKFLERYSYTDLIGFVEQSLALLDEINYKKIIITFTDNVNCPAISEKALLKMHLQEHMQRIEMQIQTRTEENLAVLFIDPVNENTDKLLRNIYFELFNDGDFINEYKHIKDSLNIEHSHQSVGIQLSDFISGAFSAVLKSFDSGNYGRGRDMFLKYVHPNLRSHYGSFWGYGLREVPSSSSYRNKIAKLYKQALSDFENGREKKEVK